MRWTEENSAEQCTKKKNKQKDRRERESAQRVKLDSFCGALRVATACECVYISDNNKQQQNKAEKRRENGKAVTKFVSIDSFSGFSRFVQSGAKILWCAYVIFSR